MTALISTTTLSSGTQIPKLAFGTGTAWYVGSNDGPINKELVQSIKSALSLGYTHLDTAEAYGTEKEVGVAITESSIPREKLFITSKVYKSMDDPYAAGRASLERLGIKYLDLFLLHSPFNIKDMKATWQAAERLVDEGLAKHIGVSNFRVQDLEQVTSVARIQPVVNQIEYNPYLQQREIKEWCDSHGILIESYSPLSSIVHSPGGPVDAVVNDLANKYHKTPAQVLMCWNMQKGNVVITTSSKEERQKEYLGSLDFQLSNDEIATIDREGAKVHFRKYWVPQFEGN